MGARGPNALQHRIEQNASTYRQRYFGQHLWELLWGPAPWQKAAATVAELEHAWKHEGGREELMDADCHFRKPGERPWSWWQWDVSKADKKRATELGARCEAEALMLLRKCRRGEQNAILANGGAIIKQQIAELDEREGVQ